MFLKEHFKKNFWSHHWVCVCGCCGTRNPHLIDLLINEPISEVFKPAFLSGIGRIEKKREKNGENILSRCLVGGERGKKMVSLRPTKIFSTQNNEKTGRELQTNKKTKNPYMGLS